MKMIWFLLRASWKVVLLAAAIGALSGVASVGLVAIILRTLQREGFPTVELAVYFALLCIVILATRVATQFFLARLSQNTLSQLRLGLCRRILDAPLRHLEQLGEERLLSTLTGDVFLVSQVMIGIPHVGVSVVILFFGSIYLGTLSPALVVWALLFLALGVATYWYLAAFAQVYVERGRAAQDVALRHIQTLIGGVKELKIHGPRRREFYGDILTTAEKQVRQHEFTGAWLQDTATAAGQLLFFVAIGLLLFVWPRVQPEDPETLTGFTLTILYLMSPVEQIMAWLPFIATASASIATIDRLGLQLNEEPAESITAAAEPAEWKHIVVAGVTHTYLREGRDHPFSLGPISLTLTPGEIVFIVGGNGSGKTTLAKLLTGLYIPEDGEIRLNGDPVTDATRERYRQLFSVVFDDATLFEGLWGLPADNLDQQAAVYLKQLELDHVVKIQDGMFSSIHLSRGQRKRLALLTAYLEDRPIYLFDEWAADQDPTFKQVFYHRLLPELKRQGKTVVAITHDDRYFHCADRLIKLEDGKMREVAKALNAERDADGVFLRESARSES